MRWDPRDQPCIPALTTGADLQRVKLNAVEVLRRADEIAAVYGDTPGETVAVIEWLLGLICAADEYPETDDEWQEWVEDRRPLAPVADWLSGHPGCWDLFDPAEPLGQNANLLPHLEAFGVGPAQMFIERAGDYNQHFDHHHLHHPAPVPADAAFRAMLTQHVYGLGGRAMIKAKDMGLPAAFTNNAVCRLGGRVRVLALGDTLGDTLRLNLAPWGGKPGTLNLTWTGRTRRTFTANGVKEARTPDGPADLHTVLGRSVAMRPALLADGSIAVDRVLLGPGETLTELPAAYLQDAVTYENATGKKTLFKPSATRDLWRESHALYAAVADRDKGADLYGRLAMLSGRRIHLWTVGIVARQTKVTTWVADTFPYVPGRETDLRHAAEQGSAVCEYVAKALYLAASTAREIAYPNPKPADKPAQLTRFNGEPEMWAGAGPAFHTVLDAVADGHPTGDALADFGREIRDMATSALNARLDSLPPSGQGLQARVQAQARLRGLLDHPKAPNQLKETHV